MKRPHSRRDRSSDCGSRSRATDHQGLELARTAFEILEARRVLAASLTLSGPTQVVFEGERAQFTLTLSEPLRTAESVTLTTAAGTATLGRDYFNPTATRILFSPGQTTKTFFVPTLRDPGGDIREGMETFQVIVTPVNAALGTRSHTVRIVDFVATPRISITDVAVVEGNSGATPANFVVSLSTPYPRPVTVAYATRDGSATVADQDYTAANGVLTFSPGETAKTVTVDVAGDLKAETDETFSLLLSSPTNATLLKGTGVATIRNDEADQPGFQITLDFVTTFYGEVPTNVRLAATQAAQRWQRVIIGDIPGFTEESTGLFVDDFRMRVQIGLLGDGSDGPGAVLANALPLQYRTGSSTLPWLGETGIDPADVNRSDLVGVLVHEIGHALGFGRSNAGYQRWVNGFGWTGPNALREFRSIFGQPSATSVPLDENGSAHWSETVFGDELMTPFVSSSMPLSRVTVGAFEDLGYQVSYAGADTYRPPAGSPVRQEPVATPARPATPPSTVVRVPATPRTAPRTSPTRQSSSTDQRLAMSPRSAAAYPTTVLNGSARSAAFSTSGPTSATTLRSPVIVGAGVVSSVKLT